MSTEPTDKQYVLKCKTKFFRKWVQDQDRRYEREMVILIPDASDQCTRFYGAWLPEDAESFFELVGVIAPPIDSACRVSIHKGPDEKHSGPYLFMMTKGVEEIFLKLKEGSTVMITILPENAEEEIADEARDSDGSYDLISGQETL